VLGARGVCSNLLADMVRLGGSAASRRELKELDGAIADLKRALGSDHEGNPLWLDETHVGRCNGHEVFFHAKEAAKQLHQLSDAKRGAVPEAAVQDFITRLLKAGRLLAVVSAQDAAREGPNPKRIAQDLNQLTLGDGAASRGKASEAIQHYCNAWSHIEHFTISCVPGLAGRKIQVEFHGADNHPYVIQASTDLSDWVTLGSATCDSEGALKFTDPDAAKFTARFYRVVEK
jgi:hypothetical protein